MTKRILILIVATLLIVGMVGCQATTTSPVAAVTSKAADAATPAPAVTSADPATPAEIVNLVWLMGDPGTVPKDQAIVEEAMNKLSSEAIGANVHTLYMKNENVLLALSSGEYFDMTFTCEWFNNYAVQAINGYFADLTEKLPVVAPDLYAYLPELIWKGAKVNGKIFAVPVYKDTAASQYWQFDKELIVDKLGIDTTKITDFFAIEPVLKAVKENDPKVYPMTLQEGFPALDSNFDIINRDANIGIPYSATDNKIVSVFEHEDYLSRLRSVHTWFKAGYIHPDSATNKEAVKYQPVKSGQGFPGADAIWSDSSGYEIVISKWYGPVLSTSSIRGAMNAISAGSNYIDKSLEYMQYANLNAEYRNMLGYGLEGTHYEKTAEGTVKILNDGYSPWRFSQGTFFTLLPTYPAAANMWDLVKAENDIATATDSIGFSFDITNVEAEVGVCKTIFDKYVKSLRVGATDPDVEVPKMVTELNKAGYQDIITEAQTQLDAYLAANK